MTKKIILVVVALVLIAVLALAMVFLNKNPDLGSTTNTSSESSVPVLAENIYVLGNKETRLLSTNVTITNEHGTYVAYPEKKNDSITYTIEGLEPFLLSDLPSLFEYTTTLFASEIVEESVSNRATFGLDSPSATIDITYEDGSTSTLYFGDPAPGDTGYYAMKQGDDAVYLTSVVPANYFLRNKLTFISKQVTYGAPETSAIHSLTLGGTVQEEPIVIELLAEEEVKSASGMLLETHRILSPFRGALDMSRGYEVLVSLFNVYADDVVAVLEEETDLSTFGLDNPYSLVELTGEHAPYAEGQSATPVAFTLSISKPNSEGKCYVIREGTNLIYLVDSSYFPWLELSAFDMVSRFVLIPYINDVASIAIETPQDSAVFLLTHSKSLNTLGVEIDEVSISYEGKALDTDNFKKYYQVLISARYESLYDSEEPFDPEINNELLTVVYTYNDGTVDTLHFYEGEARRQLIAVNDNPPHYITSSLYGKILEDLEKVIVDEVVVPVI